MKPIKVLELRRYSEQIGKPLQAGEIYTLMCNAGLERVKKDKYVCIQPKQLLTIAELADLDPNTKEIATRWATVASIYLNDKERPKEEAQNKAELQKMQSFFNNLQGA